MPAKICLLILAALLAAGCSRTRHEVNKTIDVAGEEANAGAIETRENLIGQYRHTLHLLDGEIAALEHDLALAATDADRMAVRGNIDALAQTRAQMAAELSQFEQDPAPHPTQQRRSVFASLYERLRAELRLAGRTIDQEIEHAGDNTRTAIREGVRSAEEGTK